MTIYRNVTEFIDLVHSLYKKEENKQLMPTLKSMVKIFPRRSCWNRNSRNHKKIMDYVENIKGTRNIK